MAATVATAAAATTGTSAGGSTASEPAAGLLLALRDFGRRILILFISVLTRGHCSAGTGWYRYRYHTRR